MWGILVSAGVWLFKSRIGLFISSALLWMGINYGSVKMVLEPTIALLDGFMDQSGAGVGGTFAPIMFNWMGVLNFDRAVTMIVSAYVTKQGVTAARLAWFKTGAGAS